MGTLFKGEGGRSTWIFYLRLVEKEDEKIEEGASMSRK